VRRTYTTLIFYTRTLKTFYEKKKSVSNNIYEYKKN